MHSALTFITLFYNPVLAFFYTLTEGRWRPAMQRVRGLFGKSKGAGHAVWGECYVGCVCWMCAAAAAAIKIAPVGDSFTAGVVSGDRTAALRPCQTVASVLSVCGDDGPAGRLCRRNPGMYVSGQSDRAGQCQPAGMPTHRSLPCHRNPLLTSAAGRMYALIIKYIFPNRWPGDIRTTAGAPAGPICRRPDFQGTSHDRIDPADSNAVSVYRLR